MAGIKYLMVFGVAMLAIMSAMGEKEARVICYRRTLVLYPDGSKNENCTHVVFRVSRLDEKMAHVTETLTFILGKYKAQYPYFKLILQLDPYSKSSNIPQVISSQAGRSRIIKDLAEIMKKVGYDGIDLVFRHESFIQGEATGNITTSEEKKKAFRFVRVYETAILASELREEVGGIVSGYFLRNITKSDFHRMKLSEVAEKLDFMAIAAFEKDKTKPYTEIAAPLYSKDGDSVSRTIEWYLKMGAPRDKIVMCIQTYGISHTLDNPDVSRIGAPSLKNGWSLNNVYIAGYLPLSAITEPEWKIYRDDLSKAPYAVQYLQWGSFEDETSVYIKAQYIKDNKLGGVALIPHEDVDPTFTELPFTKYLSDLLNN